MKSFYEDDCLFYYFLGKILDMKYIEKIWFEQLTLSKLRIIISFVARHVL